MSENLEKLRLLFSAHVESIDECSESSIPVGAIEEAVDKIDQIYSALPDADVPSQVAVTLENILNYGDANDLWNTHSCWDGQNTTFHSVYDAIKEASDWCPPTKMSDLNVAVCCRLTELQDSAIYPDWKGFAVANYRKKMMVLHGGARLSAADVN